MKPYLPVIGQTQSIVRMLKSISQQIGMSEDVFLRLFRRVDCDLIPKVNRWGKESGFRVVPLLLYVFNDNLQGLIEIWRFSWWGIGCSPASVIGKYPEVSCNQLVLRYGPET
jgi:hypothetical protein